MKVSELKQVLQDCDDDLDVVIPVYRVGTAGPIPAVNVSRAFEGFDWDKGRLILHPGSQLREIGRDEVKAIREKYEELSWSHYKISTIKKALITKAQRLADSLRELHDIQNGPPLLEHKNEWEIAMSKAQAALAAWEKTK